MSNSPILSLFQYTAHPLNHFGIDTYYVWAIWFHPSLGGNVLLLGQCKQLQLPQKRNPSWMKLATLSRRGEDAHLKIPMPPQRREADHPRILHHSQVTLHQVTSLLTSLKLSALRCHLRSPSQWPLILRLPLHPHQGPPLLGEPDLVPRNSKHSGIPGGTCITRWCPQNFGKILLNVSSGPCVPPLVISMRPWRSSLRRWVCPSNQLHLPKLLPRRMRRPKQVRRSLLQQRFLVVAEHEEGLDVARRWHAGSWNTPWGFLTFSEVSMFGCERWYHLSSFFVWIPYQKDIHHHVSQLGERPHHHHAAGDSSLAGCSLGKTLRLSIVCTQKLCSIDQIIHDCNHDLTKNVINQWAIELSYCDSCSPAIGVGLQHSNLTPKGFTCSRSIHTASNQQWMVVVLISCTTVKRHW